MAEMMALMDGPVFVERVALFDAKNRVKAKKAIMALPPGGTLEVLATDPGAIKDFAAFCRTTGHELVEQTTEGNVFRFVLRRKA